MEQKIVFFDIDGTLIPEGGRYIVESAAKAIHQAQENGHLMFINTGRCRTLIDRALSDFGFDGFICGCGTHILYKGKTLLYSPVSPSLSRKVADLGNDFGLDILFESAHDMYSGDSPSHPQAKMLLEGLKHYGIRIVPPEVPDFSFDKFVTWKNPETDFSAFVEAISPYFTFIDRGNDFAEFVPKGFSKATGIAQILDYLHLPLESAIAIGDSTNDLPMLTYVNHSVAMGNSMPPSVKERVSFVTRDILDDGIAYALKHFSLI